jgi:hypothetical protein
MDSQCTVNVQFAQSMHSQCTVCTVCTVNAQSWLISWHSICQYTALFSFWGLVTWYFLSRVYVLRSPDMLLICISDPAIPSSLLLAKHLPIHSTSTGSTFMPQRYVTKEINYIGKRRQMVHISHAVHGGPLTCSCASFLTSSLLSSCSSSLFPCKQGVKVVIHTTDLSLTERGLL